MDREHEKKREAGQTAAFYAALIICLVAVGVGMWRMLQPDDAAQTAQSGTSAVSSAIALPGGGAIGPEEPEPQDASEDAESAIAEAQPFETEESAFEDGTENASSVAAGDGSGVTENAASATGSASNAGNASGGAGKTSEAAPKAVGGSAAIPTDSKNAASGKSTSDKSASGKSASDKSASDKDKSSGKASGDTVRPVEGAVVTAYSMDKLLYNETMRDWRTHDGVDIAADAGTAVAAARAGTVESVAADPVMGMTVVIRHEGNWETVYSSLTDMPEVEAGDAVTAGQVVGFVGETAASESALGPHLHFSVLQDGKPVNPDDFLP